MMPREHFLYKKKAVRIYLFNFKHVDMRLARGHDVSRTCFVFVKESC